jgi:hypothetical protein
MTNFSAGSISSISSSIFELAMKNAPDATRDGEAFPVLLHKLLDEMEAEENEHIISWNPDGKSFTIHQPKVFGDTIMSRWFKNQTRYKSFQVRRVMLLFAMELDWRNSFTNSIHDFSFHIFYSSVNSIYTALNETPRGKRKECVSLTLP